MHLQFDLHCYLSVLFHVSLSLCVYFYLIVAAEEEILDGAVRASQAGIRSEGKVSNGQNARGVLE